MTKRRNFPEIAQKERKEKKRRRNEFQENK
jgi:hypothetical protein